MISKGQLHYKRFFGDINDKEIENVLASHNLLDIETILNDFLSNYFTEDTVYIHPSATISSNAVIEGQVYIGRNSVVQDFAVVKGPVVILDNVLIGKSAFVRNRSVIGSYSIVGHSSEVSDSIILNNSTISHISGASFSLVGSRVNLGAYASTNSYSFIDKEITVLDNFGVPTSVVTGKFGAIIGDGCKIGSLVSINPGTVLEPECVIYPNISLKSGYYREHSKIYIPGYNNSIKCTN